jgi:ribosomal subunit interface protein
MLRLTKKTDMNWPIISYILLRIKTRSYKGRDGGNYDMQTSLTFKNLYPSENLKSYANTKIDRLDKYLDNPPEASIVLTVEKLRHIAEINFMGDRLNLVVRKETNDMYSAIDMALDRLIKKIKKGKQKKRNRRYLREQKILGQEDPRDE